MNEVIFLFFVMMTVGVYFRIRDLVTAALQENVMMAKCGRYYRSYEHILRNNTYNCDGCVNLVFHSFSNIQCKHFKCYFPSPLPPAKAMANQYFVRKD